MSKSAKQKWDELLFTPVDPLPLALFRIAFASVMLLRFLTLCLDFDRLFTPGSLVPLEASRLFSESPSDESVPYLRWELFGISATTTWARLLFAGYGVSILALLLGSRTRLAALAVFLLTVSIHRRVPIIWTGGDVLLQLFAFWLLFVPAGGALSFDARKRKAQALAPLPVRAWALLLLQGQLALLYLSTVLLKLETASWKAGTLMAEAWQLPFYARPWSASLVGIPGLVEAATWGTLLFELAFPLLIWSRQFRPWLLALGVALHLGIELTFRAGPFSAVMLAGYCLFLPSNGLRRWIERLDRQRTRTAGLLWQFARRQPN